VYIYMYTHQWNDDTEWTVESPEAKNLFW
jgi:hypothetical protein